MSWFRKNKKRSIIRRKNTSAERIILLVKRSGLIIGVIAGLGWMGSWFFLSDAAGHTADWAQNKLLKFSSNSGFSLKNIMVEGRFYTDPDAILAIINIEKGDALFALDTSAAQDMLEKLSWVKHAHIQRRLPDTIYINIQERVPFALWQTNQQLKLIDDEGVILTQDDMERFQDLVIVVGKQAPDNVKDIVSLIEAEPDVQDKVESAVHVAGRRWDLVLKNGMIVKLPKDDTALALATIAKAQREEALLDKDIKMVDLREQGRIVIQTKPGAVQDYNAGYQSTTATSGNPI